ncbi:MAG: YebC/PmpR family DNA-binding transcriptional regulator [Bacilli bacterium]|nr:YebC/PmpR family DNA-binding transcriptional regulator [Bacilli bacterium]MDD3304629.1 YebC/PmpR family DNA-binding transcriptional regulator [Bacilli bacterium]MDD4053542.1 YebC/PmpR family DNA-binding transcriptional regulator [Bacilli bacterium]MDD4411491.1 YebC/PmpR family DNA-binding transcriptional regulator [Bacilli bacterium]
MGRAYEVRKASIAKTGAAKAKIYSMYAKEIYSAAKKSPDPDANPILKRLIDKAKKDQVPSDIINRAIDKVNSGVDETYISVRYEGFGPSSSTIIIDCLTDNVNRTIGYIRGVFSKAKAKLGVLGSVSHMYDNLCVISFKGLTEEETLEALINGEVDVSDIELEDDIVTLYGSPTDLYKIKSAILEAKPEIVFELDEITMIPHERITLEGEDIEQFQKLLNLLDDIEDVQQVYHNVNMD